MDSQNSISPMDSIKFIEAIKEAVRDDSIESVLSDLASPPGRKPDPNLVKLSLFYNNLSYENRDNIAAIVKEAVDYAIFGFLCVLDGVRVIEDQEEKGEFELRYINQGINININEDQELHDIYNATDID